jgi:paraquat-inducible protein A
MTDIDTLIACPRCDALYRAAQPGHGERAVCHRCKSVLIAPKDGAILQMLALSITVAVLLIAAVFLPFLRIERAGLSHDSSIFDAALAFSSSGIVPLTIAVAALIVLIPLLRVLLVAYVLLPLAFDRPAFQSAARALRWAEILRPWAMAEIFVLGCGVALVKVADLATVIFGPAFWMFAVLVVINLLQDSFMCKWTIWNSLDTAQTP